ncbi:MAG: DUF924-domain-containing protein [Monoraphidium minutum]|nr:MAG: DUF924-domain-containing protein [Monoraphidium minutum]
MIRAALTVFSSRRSACHRPSAARRIASMDPKPIHPRAREILTWWLGDAALDAAGAAPAAGAPYPSEKAKLWFAGGAASDAEVVARFGADLEAAAAGGLDGWGDPAGAGPLNTLAGVILCDQFSRNAYRGTPRAFDLDPKALLWAQRLLETPGVDEWPLSFKTWIFLPFEHSEDIEMQRRCVELYEAERRRSEEQGAPPEVAAAAKDFLAYARAHLAVVEKWGRFPHRNAVLGRESTPEELAGLADGSIGRF